MVALIGILAIVNIAEPTMESVGQTAVDLSTVVAVIVFCLGLVVGIGGMWLAWRVVRKLPDEADYERNPEPTPGDAPDPDAKP